MRQAFACMSTTRGRADVYTRRVVDMAIARSVASTLLALLAAYLQAQQGLAAVSLSEICLKLCLKFCLNNMLYRE